MNGKLIVIEGLDGSGKSTQIELLSAKLRAGGRKIRQIKLPDYDDPSSTLVKMYLRGDFGSSPSEVGAYAASSFYAVDRYANYTRHWKNDYLAGMLIVSDRYTTSNAYHQLVKLDRDKWDEYLSWLEDYEYVKLGIPKPDLVIYLDMPIDVSQKLMSRRYNGVESKKDVHEANTAYLESCRKTAAYAAEKLGWSVVSCVVDGEPLPIETIAYEIFMIVKEKGILDA